MTLKIAIVGSGPAGMYAADTLLRKKASGCRIDVIDRLPTPFGLVRAGVAPDHQGNKNVARVFDRTLAKEGVRFLGNVQMGRDISFDELKRLYDVVILAIGAPVDRKLGVPGEDKKGVFGSCAFVGWYNGHPDHRDLAPDLGGTGACVIGNGNVAIDVARILAKTPEELAKSDLADQAAEALAANPQNSITIIGRRGPLEAGFTNPELSELGRLARAVALCDAGQLPDSVGAVDEKERRTKEANLATLADFAANRPQPGRGRIDLCFFARPAEIIGDEAVQGLRIERTEFSDGKLVGTGEYSVIPCSLVISCIGYRVVDDPTLPIDAERGIIENTGGKVTDGVYVVGWAKRGPSGTIATNRADSMAVAERILAEVDEDDAKAGPDGIDALLRDRNVRVIGYEDWSRINEAEMQRAEGGAPRRKFTSIEEMLAV